MKASLAGHLLLAHGDPRQLQAFSRALSGHVNLRPATTGEDALRLARQAVPDVILLDAELPGLSGLQVCEALQADPLLADVPVIFTAAHDDPALEVAVLERGAVDFIGQPVQAAQLVARVKTQLRLKRRSDELQRLARADGLTGTANRRAFDEAFEQEWRRARRAAQPLALLLIDVDFFKNFAVHYGAPAGDQCLKAVAAALQAAKRRPGDLLARHDTKVFALLLPATPRTGALGVAHRMLAAVERLDLPHAVSPISRHVTVSIGVSAFDAHSAGWISEPSDSRFGGAAGDGPGPSALLQAAAGALHDAKRAGRAQACFVDFADAAPSVGDDLSGPAPTQSR